MRFAPRLERPVCAWHVAYAAKWALRRCTSHGFQVNRKKRVAMRRAVMAGLGLWGFAAVVEQFLAPEGLLLYTPNDWRTAERTPVWQVGGRTTRHAGYAASQIVHKRIEEHFGWAQTIGRIRQTMYRGLQRVDQQFKLTMTASNIVRMARIPCAAQPGVLQ